MALTEVNGQTVPVVSAELSQWLENHWEWESVWKTRPTDTQLSVVVSIPEHLVEQYRQYKLDQEEAQRQNRARTYRSVWESVGIPYNDDPVLAEAACLGNGAGIELVQQQKGLLMAEQKLAILQAQYEMAIDNWDRELKRANRAEKQISALQKQVGKDVRYQNMEALLHAKMDENWALDRLVDSLKDQLHCYEQEKDQA